MVRWLVILSTLLLLQVEAVGRVRPAEDVIGSTPPLLLAMQEAEEEEREPGPADLEEAIKIARKRYGGEVSRAETVVRDGRDVHEIRILDEENGIVRTVRIDPQTGRIIPQERRPD